MRSVEVPAFDVIRNPPQAVPLMTKYEGLRSNRKDLNLGGYKMDVTEKVKLVVAALEDRKARDIRVIKVSGITTIADYFVICDGSNDNQLKALCDSVEEKLLDVPMKHREGTANGGWLLLDYYDIIVHIFSEEMRSFYDLERIWKDGTVINPGDM